MKLFVIASTAFVTFLAPPQEAWAQSSQASKKEIEQVVETFRLALIKKDKDSFLSLFLREDTPWIGVTTDASLEAITKINAEAGRPSPAKLSSSGNPRTFIEGIAATEGLREEKLRNVQIDTDGNVAQVFLDYRAPRITGDLGGAVKT